MTINELCEAIEDCDQLIFILEDQLKRSPDASDRQIKVWNKRIRELTSQRKYLTNRLVSQT